MKYYTNLDLNQNELKKAKIEIVSSFPSSPVEGQIVYLDNGTVKSLYTYNGTSWDANTSANLTGADVIVAASDSKNKHMANFICTGTNDETTILTACASVPANGTILLLDGNYYTGSSNTLVLDKTNLTFEGQSRNTIIHGSIVGYVSSNGEAFDTAMYNVVVKNIKVTGDILLGGSLITIDNVQTTAITIFSSSAVSVRNSTFVSIVNSNAFGTTFGDMSIVDNVISDTTTWDGVSTLEFKCNSVISASFSNCSDVKVLENHFIYTAATGSTNRQCGFYGVTNAIVESNTFSTSTHYTYSIFSDGTGSNIVYGNNITHLPQFVNDDVKTTVKNKDTNTLLYEDFIVKNDSGNDDIILFVGSGAQLNGGGTNSKYVKTYSQILDDGTGHSRFAHVPTVDSSGDQPTNNYDLTTKIYVDTQDATKQTQINKVNSAVFISSPYKEAVRVVSQSTDGNLPLSGLSPTTIDGITIANGDRVLVKDQTDQTQNGIYVVNSSGVWTRAYDMPTSATQTTLYNATWRPTEGATQLGFFFIISNATAFTVGTTAITFASMSKIYNQALATTSQPTFGKVTVSAAPTTGSDLGNKTYIDAQVATKQATITGGATTITSSNLTVSRALTSDASGKVAVSAVTSTELGYVSGVTSAIQTQLSGKQATITGAASSIVSSNLNNSIVAVTDGTGKLASSTVTTTTLGYLDATSSIQTQFNTVNSELLSSPFMGTVKCSSTSGDGNLGLSGLTPATLDGVTLVNGDKVLVRNQTTTSQNGIYIVNSAGAWARSPDMPTSATQATLYNAIWKILQGTTQTGWWGLISNTSAFTVGSSSIAFSVVARLWNQDLTTAGVPSFAGMTITASGGITCSNAGAVVTVGAQAAGGSPALQLRCPNGASTAAYDVRLEGVANSGTANTVGLGTLNIIASNMTINTTEKIWRDGNNTKSLGASGYQKLASGLIIQWGYAPIASGGSGTSITFPTTFTTAVASITVTPNSGTVVAGSSLSITTSSFTIVHNGASSTNFGWMAIGY